METSRKEIPHRLGSDAADHPSRRSAAVPTAADMDAKIIVMRVPRGIFVYEEGEMLPLPR